LEAAVIVNRQLMAEERLFRKWYAKTKGVEGDWRKDGISAREVWSRRWARVRARRERIFAKYPSVDVIDDLGRKFYCNGVFHATWSRGMIRLAPCDCSGKGFHPEIKTAGHMARSAR
jgi:hypothetical protein